MTYSPQTIQRMQDSGALSPGILFKQTSKAAESLEDKFDGTSSQSTENTYSFLGSVRTTSRPSSTSNDFRPFTSIYIHTASLVSGVKPKEKDQVVIENNRYDLGSIIASDTDNEFYCFEATRIGEDGSATGVVPSNITPGTPFITKEEAKALIMQCVYDWAEQDNPDSLPTTKIPDLGIVKIIGLPLPNTGRPGQVLATDGTIYEFVDPATGGPGGGFNQAQVDARIRALVNPIALQGNTDQWPVNKLSDITTQKITDIPQPDAQGSNDGDILARNLTGDSYELVPRPRVQTQRGTIASELVYPTVNNTDQNDVVLDGFILIDDVQRTYRANTGIQPGDPSNRVRTFEFDSPGRTGLFLPDENETWIIYHTTYGLNVGVDSQTRQRILINNEVDVGPVFSSYITVDTDDIKRLEAYSEIYNASQTYNQNYGPEPRSPSFSGDYLIVDDPSIRQGDTTSPRPRIYRTSSNELMVFGQRALSFNVGPDGNRPIIVSFSHPNVFRVERLKAGASGIGAISREKIFPQNPDPTVKQTIPLQRNELTLLGYTLPSEGDEEYRLEIDVRGQATRDEPFVIEFFGSELREKDSSRPGDVGIDVTTLEYSQAASDTVNWTWRIGRTDINQLMIEKFFSSCFFY